MTARLPRKKWPIIAGAAVCLLLGGLAVLWAGGVFKVKTADGILVVQVNEPNAEVFVDGDRVAVSWNDGGKKAEIHVKPGTRKVEVRKDGFGVDGTELTFKDGDRVVFTARLLPDEPRVAKADQPPPEKPSPPDTKTPDVPPVAGAANDDKDFVPLFNGKDLTGWKTHPSQPGNWRAEKGILIGSGPAASYLYSERDDYKDFHLRVEARINDGGNSGLFFRTPFGPGRPAKKPQLPLGYEAQINSIHSDSHKTGSLFAGSDGAVVTIEESPVPAGEWFTEEVIAKGNHLVVKVNGKTTADYTDDKRLFTIGHLALQQLNPQTVAEFRKIEIKVLPSAVAAAPPTPAGDGFTPLFNGKDLTGWTGLNGAPAAWEVKNGYMEVVPGKGDIRTKETFGPDFKLHVEFWLPLMPDAQGQARANSGIFLQGRYEVQILDSYMNETYRDGSAGALYKLIAPDRQAQQRAIRPPEQWQSYDITFHAPRVDGTGQVAEMGRVTVVLNDETLISDGRFDKITPGGAGDPLGLPGPIRLQDHGSGVRFRNIRIKELPPADAAAPPAPAADDFVSLFNGKDLTGWSTHPSQPGNWRVENGILTASSDGISHLYTDRGDFTDFHLRLEARINDGGKTGVYFRAPFGPNLPADKPTWPSGYNAKMDARRLGGLLIDLNPGLHRTREPVLRPGEWTTFEVIAQGNHFVIKVNGETTSDYTDDQRLHAKGRIVLQQHGAQTVAEFRKVEVKELK